MISLKCDQPYFMQIPHINSNLHNRNKQETIFPNFIHRFQKLDFKMLVLGYTSKLLPVHKRDEKMGFLNISLGCISNFSQFTKELENWDF